MHSESFVKVGRTSAVHGAGLISPIHHLASGLSWTCPWNLIQYTRPSFSHMQEGLSTRLCSYLWHGSHACSCLIKNTGPILLHMIPNLLSLLISLAITCSMHTPHVFPSLLHTERREVSITMATISSQLHINVCRSESTWLATVAADTFPQGGLLYKVAYCTCKNSVPL